MTYTEEHFPLSTFLEWFVPGTVFVRYLNGWEDEVIEDTFLVLEVNKGDFAKVITKCIASTRENRPTWEAEFNARECYNLYKKNPSLFSFPV